MHIRWTPYHMSTSYASHNMDTTLDSVFFPPDMFISQSLWYSWGRQHQDECLRCKNTLPENNSSHLNIGHPKRKLAFQPSIFGRDVSFREGIYPTQEEFATLCGEARYMNTVPASNMVSPSIHNLVGLRICMDLCTGSWSIEGWASSRWYKGPKVYQIYWEAWIWCGLEFAHVDSFSSYEHVGFGGFREGV